MTFKRIGDEEFTPLVLKFDPKRPLDELDSSVFWFNMACLEFIGDIPPPIDRFLIRKQFKLVIYTYLVLNEALIIIMLTRKWAIYGNGADFFSVILRFASWTNNSAVFDKPFAIKCWCIKRSNCCSLKWILVCATMLACKEN